MDLHRNSEILYLKQDIVGGEFCVSVCVLPVFHARTGNKRTSQPQSFALRYKRDTPTQMHRQIPRHPPLNSFLSRTIFVKPVKMHVHLRAFSSHQYLQAFQREIYTLRDMKHLQQSITTSLRPGSNLVQNGEFLCSTNKPPQLFSLTNYSKYKLCQY